MPGESYSAKNAKLVSNPFEYNFIINYGFNFRIILHICFFNYFACVLICVVGLQRIDMDFMSMR